MESRLDGLLSRIAMETQEIRELEQQLTDGQILANKALQRELQEVIHGLQEYLRGLRLQARHSQQQVDVLQAENRRLHCLLEDAQRHWRMLEDTAPTHIQVKLSELWLEAQSLRDRQAELEAELLHLRTELTWQMRLQRPPTQFDQTRTQLDQFTAALSDLQNQGDPVELKDRNRTRTSKQALQQNHKSRLQDSLTQDELTQDELQKLRTKLHISESRARLVQQNLEEQLESTRQQLQDAQQEKDVLQLKLRSVSSGHQRSVDRLHRKLRQLRSSTSDTEQLTAEQLRSTTEQLKVLNDTVELLDSQGRLDEQQNQTYVEQLKAELDQAQSQTHKLRQKLDRIRTRTRAADGLGAPSLVSQGAQDSGLELQYLSSPDQRQQWAEPPEGECVSSDPAESRGGGPALQTPPLGPTRLLCTPSAGGATLHCNIPEHSVTLLEEEKLRMDTKQLRVKLRRLWCATQVCDEVECLEKTLLKRRAELRHADRLLLEAQSSRQAARGQADVLQLRLWGGASCLLEATQNLRKLQEKLQLLRRRRDKEEAALREVEEALRSRHQEFQQIGTEIQTDAHRLR